jgi:polynucleotide 5'-kinase involved in rRNA processing
MTEITTRVETPLRGYVFVGEVWRHERKIFRLEEVNRYFKNNYIFGLKELRNKLMFIFKHKI